MTIKDDVRLGAVVFGLLIILLFLLGGCATSPVGSVAGGECKLPGLHTPVYAVKGKQPYDQEWVDDATEALVRGCKQPRPKARPASIDTPRASVVVAPMKKHWWQR